MLEEAEKRDHRRLAQELDLCSWPPELGPGLVVWHPKGGTVRRLMEDYSRARHATGGYEFVYSPHIARSLLWETSGHLDFYADGMYPPMELDEGVKYYPKPMNCPFHFLIFRSRQRSYRELPLRLFELGTVYRYELSGVVHGLHAGAGLHPGRLPHLLHPRAARRRDRLPARLRARPPAQVRLRGLRGQPVDPAVREVRRRRRRVGGGHRGAADRARPREPRLPRSTRAAARSTGRRSTCKVRDAIGRHWQLSDHPVRLQRAPALRAGVRRRRRPAPPPRGDPPGAVRLGRALLRHPRRALRRRLPDVAGAGAGRGCWACGPTTRPHVDALVERLRAAGFRADTVEADEPLGARIRRAKLEKLPYVLVVGDDDRRRRRRVRRDRHGRREPAGRRASSGACRSATSSPASTPRWRPTGVTGA